MIIVGAAKAELSPLITMLGLARRRSAGLSLYASSQHLALVTGVGAARVSAALEAFLRDYPEAVDEGWLNIGIAGQASSASTVGNGAWVSKVMAPGGWERELVLPEFVHPADAVLVSSKTEPTKITERELAAAPGRVYDMELAVLSRRLDAHRASLSAFKVISDNAAGDLERVTPDQASRWIAQALRQIPQGYWQARACGSELAEALITR